MWLRGDRRCEADENSQVGGVVCRGGVGAGGVVSLTSIPETVPFLDIRRRFLDGDSL